MTTPTVEQREAQTAQDRAGNQPRSAAYRANEPDASTLRDRERELDELRDRVLSKEAALEEAAQRMAAALASARVGIWSWNLRSMRVEWSEEQYALLGFEPYSVQPSFELFMSCLHPDDAKRGKQEFEIALRERRAYDTEYRVIWPNGEVHWLQSRGQFIFDESGAADAPGNVAQMSGVTLDIDRLKQAEREANDARQRLRTIAEATPGTIFTYRESNGERCFPYATAHLRDTHGIEPEDLMRDASLMFSRIHPDDVAGIMAANEESARTMSMWHQQFRHDHPVKGEVWIEAYSSPLLEPDGSITWHGIAHDVTELKQTEGELLRARERAEAADRAKSEFLANMSHEIRTPMSAIMGYADILGARMHDPDNLQSLETIRRNGRYLLEIIDDILDLSRVEAGKLALDLKRVSPERLALDVQSLLKLRAADKGLALDVEFDGLLPETIETDPTRVRQILINLVENAIKFTDRGEVKVVLRLDAERSALVFAVVDTGAGIPEDMLPKLFRPFTQADTSVTRRFGGSGLGLSICHGLARMLGGDVTVASRLDEGSTFTVSIATGDLRGVPLRAAYETEPAPAEARLQLRSLACGVLVVDDRREIRYVAQHMLEEAGADVALAVDGRDAVNRVREAGADARPFDAILLDMQMPVLDGYAAAAQIRRLGFDGPIVALTANAMQDDERKCLDAGCDAYLSKPLDREVLVDTIAHYTQEITPAELKERRAQWEASGAEADSSADADAETDGFKVLLVDDSEDTCAMLKLLLEASGHAVATAGNGSEALAATDCDVFDTIVLDLGLPGMSGAEVVAELKRRQQLERCRFICLSGSTLRENEWRDLGFDHFLQKPAKLTELKQLLGPRI